MGIEVGCEVVTAELVVAGFDVVTIVVTGFDVVVVIVDRLITPVAIRTTAVKITTTKTPNTIITLLIFIIHFFLTYFRTMRH
jgi:hypothetical protein